MQITRVSAIRALALAVPSLSKTLQSRRGEAAGQIKRRLFSAFSLPIYTACSGLCGNFPRMQAPHSNTKVRKWTSISRLMTAVQSGGRENVDETPEIGGLSMPRKATPPLLSSHPASVYQFRPQNYEYAQSGFFCFLSASFLFLLASKTDYRFSAGILRFCPCSLIFGLACFRAQDFLPM